VRAWPLVVACVVVGACGKSRVDADPPAWDPPTPGNGYEAVGERTCPVLRPADYVDLPYRTAPEARIVWRLDRGSGPSLTATPNNCIATSAPYSATEVGVFCVRTDGQVNSAIADGLHRVRDIASSDDGLYFVDDDLDGTHSRILRAAGPGVVVPIVVAGGQRGVGRIVARDGLVYWISDHHAIRGGRAGEEARTFVDDRRIDGRFLAVDDDAFYALADGALTAFPKSGKYPLRITDVTYSSIQDLAVAGDWVYWADVAGVHRMRRDQAHVYERVTGPIPGIGPFTIAAGSIWAATCSGVARIPLAKDASPTILPTTGPVIGRPTLDPVTFSVDALVRQNDSEHIDVVAVTP